jgi:hypothetical protein
MSYLTTPLVPVAPSDAKANREAFERALIEYMDDDMRDRVTWMIWRLADFLARERGMGKDAAVNQATEFVAACVWNKAQGRQRQ